MNTPSQAINYWHPFHAVYKPLPLHVTNKLVLNNPLPPSKPRLVTSAPCAARVNWALRYQPCLCVCVFGRVCSVWLHVGVSMCVYVFGRLCLCFYMSDFMSVVLYEFLCATLRLGVRVCVYVLEWLHVFGVFAWLCVYVRVYVCVWVSVCNGIDVFIVFVLSSFDFLSFICFF